MVVVVEVFAVIAVTMTEEQHFKSMIITTEVLVLLHLEYSDQNQTLVWPDSINLSHSKTSVNSWEIKPVIAV